VAEVTDCTWCGSAGSIEYGICQVCLMPYPNELIELPDPDDPTAPIEPRISLPQEQEKQEQPPASAATA
jgi:hypothetical protein